MARKDDVTMDLPGVARRRGRPPTGKAKSAAQRKREQRARERAEGVAVPLTVKVSPKLAEALKARTRFTDEVTISDVVERNLSNQLLRKR